MKLYVDGVLVHSAALSNGGVYLNPGKLYIGRSENFGASGTLWNGKKKQGQRKVDLKKNMLWGAPRSGPMIFSHQEGVTKCPDNFEITAESDMVAIDGFASKTKPIWGFQTHIEATQAFIDDHNVPNVDSHEAFEFGHRLLDNFILSLT